VPRSIGILLGFCALIAGAALYYETHAGRPVVDQQQESVGDSWLDDLYSPNPAEAEEAVRDVEELGERALPIIRATLQDAGAEPPRRKAALKACAILGQRSAGLVSDVAPLLAEPDMTAEAAVALSFMGRTAFAPLRNALSSNDPVVRREALRSIGKLKERAPLDSRAVLPLLVRRMVDEDEGVRTVAATYLGIVHEGADQAVPALIDGLADENIEVRRAAATALGSFGSAAQAAIPALRRASGDTDPDVAREAGRALVKLQGR
jgi:HEAT repeat protein